MKQLLITTFLLLITANNALAVTDIPASREWQRAGFGGGGTYPMLLPDNTTPNKIYLASDVAGNLYSTDSGNQWEYMNTGTSTIINAVIAQSETNPNILYSLGKTLIKSVDGGDSWSTVGNYKGTRSTIYKTIAIGRTDPDLVFVGLDNGKIVKTANGGQTWVDYDTPFGTNIKPTFLYLDPTDSYLIVGGQTNNGMIKYTLSSGAETVIAPTGTNSAYNWDYGTYSISGTEHFCVTAGWKIACTSNLGTSWSYTAATSSDSNFIINRFAIKRLASTQIRIVLHMRQISTQYGTVYDYVSSDSGTTWANISANVTADNTYSPTNIWGFYGNLGNIVSITADPFNEDVFWSSTDWRIWRSDDGGVNWTEKTKGAQNVVISDVACSPTNRCFQAGMDIGLLYSDNLGDTWTAAFPNTALGAEQGVSKAGHIWRVLTIGDESDWLAGNGIVVATTSNWADFIPRVIRSEDNGVTWAIITDGLPTTQLNTLGNNNSAAWGIGYPRALAKCSANDNILALGIDGLSATENGGIFISTDAGETWDRTTQPDQWKTFNGIAFDPTDATCNTIEFAEFFHTSPNVAKTWRTTNRGTSWTAVENDIGVYDLAYGSNGTVYKVGLDTNPMIDRSTNGTTWANMHLLNTTSQIANGLWVDAKNPNRICVGVDDGTNTGTSQGSGSDGSGEGGGSIYCTADANLGSGAHWYHLTGNLPSPGGVTAITAAYDYNGQDWLLIATDGAGTWRLRLKDSLRTTVSGMRSL